jgi:hypothetical protein
VQKESQVARTDLEDATDLSAREPFDVSEQHDLALPRGQVIEGRLQGLRPLSSIETVHAFV